MGEAKRRRAWIAAGGDDWGQRSAHTARVARARGLAARAEHLVPYVGHDPDAGLLQVAPGSDDGPGAVDVALAAALVPMLLLRRRRR